RRGRRRLGRARRRPVARRGARRARPLHPAMMVGAILTLLMMRPGGATWLAAGETPVPPPDRGGDSAAGLSAPPPRRDLEGWRQALGLGWHGTTFSSKEGSHYTFQSASLGYLASFESCGMFVHGFVLLPLQTQQDGRVYGAGEF